MIADLKPSLKHKESGLPWLRAVPEVRRAASELGTTLHLFHAPPNCDAMRHTFIPSNLLIPTRTELVREQRLLEEQVQENNEEAQS